MLIWPRPRSFAPGHNHAREASTMSSYTPLRWGILGAGSIANRFCTDVTPLADHSVVAVGSRELAKANAFADKFSVPNRHDSYEALVDDPEVDVIYVATPHNFHKEHSLLAIAAGKAVLTEKPFTINRSEAEPVIAAAREQGIFLMEGMWSRCFPVWVQVRQLLKDGAIGKPRQLLADFGFQAGKTDDSGKLVGFNPAGRLFDPNLGGGALMDVGVYPVSLAQSLFGTPDSVAALATLGSTGVDENTGVLLRYPGGELAVTSTSIQTNTPQAAVILGDAGKIEVPSPWWCPKRYTVFANGKEPQTVELPFDGGGFQFEAIHVAESLRAGKTESDIVSHTDTLSVMKTLDDIRAAIGVKYPME
jgi:predicted dehydrogenase